MPAATARTRRFARAVYEWALIGAPVVFAGMTASLVWQVVWPVWSDPDAGEEKRAIAADISAMVLINGGVAAVGIAVIGWIVRFALTRERHLWPGRRKGTDAGD